MSRTDETEAVLREAFMWGTLISPLAASRIAARVGAERLFGVGVLGAGVIAVMVPASWLTPCHVIIRIIQGMFMVCCVSFNRSKQNSSRVCLNFRSVCEIILIRTNTAATLGTVASLNSSMRVMLVKVLVLEFDIKKFRSLCEK